jgi:hypothetical protein
MVGSCCCCCCCWSFEGFVHIGINICKIFGLGLWGYDGLVLLLLMLILM